MFRFHYYNWQLDGSMEAVVMLVMSHRSGPQLRKKETDWGLAGVTLEDNSDNCPLCVRKQSEKSLPIEWAIKRAFDDQLPEGLPAQSQSSGWVVQMATNF